MHQNDTIKLGELIAQLEDHKRVHGASIPVFIGAVTKDGKTASYAAAYKARYGGPSALPKGIVIECD